MDTEDITLEKSHAGKRAKKRYHTKLDRVLHDALLTKVRENEHGPDIIKRVYQQFNERYVCIVRHNRVVYEFVCDVTMRHIITFLPRKKKAR